MCLSPWYLARSLPLSSSSRAKVLGTNLISAMCASAVMMAAAQILLYLVNKLYPGLSSRVHPALPILAGMLFLFYLLSIAMHYVLLALETSRHAELLSREAEFKALKAQVNPHFLFNSLNSISALTSIDAAQSAPDVHSALRFPPELAAPRGKVQHPVRRRMELTKSYLDVERCVSAQALRVRQDVAAGCALAKCRRYWYSPWWKMQSSTESRRLSEGGEIAMTARVERDQLRLTVENPFDPDAPPMKRADSDWSTCETVWPPATATAAKLEVQIRTKSVPGVILLPWS